ncbi:UNVERIFIED_CONTAM: hypothetical protein FKN15_033033 [Acipenser sinensis]
MLLCVTEEEQQSAPVGPPPPETEDESALQVKMDKREERRQKRLQEALERQKEFDPTISLPKENNREKEEEEEEEERGRYQQEEEKTNQRNAWRDKEEEEKVEPAQEEEEVEEEQEEPQEEPEEEEKQEEVIVEKPRRSYMTPEERAEIRVEKTSREVEVINTPAPKHQNGGDFHEGTPDRQKKPERSLSLLTFIVSPLQLTEVSVQCVFSAQIRVEKTSREVEVINTPAPKHQNGGDFHEGTPDRQKKPERSLSTALSRGGLRSNLDPVESEQDSDAARLEAERKLEVLRRRRDETERGLLVLYYSQLTSSEIADNEGQFSIQPLIGVRVERKRREVEVISTPEPKHQNGGDFHQDTPDRHKKPERSLSRGGLRLNPDPVELEQDSDTARQEAEHKLEVLRRRRDETESEEFHRMRLKQQEAEQELEELKRKREERRKVLEEEEQLRKQEESQKKAREEEEKRRLKEEIERRRAEAAEKRQKITEEVSPDGEGKKPFKCVSPRGSSLKVSI